MRRLQSSAISGSEAVLVEQPAETVGSLGTVPALELVDNQGLTQQ
jgi:hypothetical protein